MGSSEGSLPSLRKTQSVFLAPVFGLAQPQLLWALGKQPSRWEPSLSLYAFHRQYSYKFPKRCKFHQRKLVNFCSHSVEMVGILATRDRIKKSHVTSFRLCLHFLSQEATGPLEGQYFLDTPVSWILTSAGKKIGGAAQGCKGFSAIDFIWVAGSDCSPETAISSCTASSPTAEFLACFFRNASIPAP